ncbi:S-formylglutathione hydrolase FrmB [Amycolatopsis bartoniae]|uniref:Acyl-CoA:diacylglycerol acyltransferase n=1 Tax=Amycolatopsis bartoniae TaxID=941986 RepID=A0A8H9IUG2_9PSEU|nr:alpha/beta hydrolase-fold protein [Amycolatopsis bartoniae]MBB2935814.1 S-formylglutathione hydrolase FrmB [Amycolatopsis bartoniae]GHF62045.1 esterase [Amycolatopsis bartoniae]
MDKPRLTRRSLLIAGASGLGVAAFTAGTATGVLPVSEAVQRALGVTSTTPVSQVGSARVERVWSAARGREIDFVTLLPSKSPPRNLPMVLVLHGLHGRARTAAPTGTLTELAGQVARHAVPPFGLVAVDGGDNYWHENQPGDDPMRMLLDEVPQWLRRRGLGGTDGRPFAVLGMSMGGFGGLLYARRRAERRQPLGGLALLAPALILSWQEMSKRNAFHSDADWASMDPLKHLSATSAVPTGVWCGTEDQFIQGVRQFIAATHPAVAFTARGKHGDSFNRTVVPSVISFLGKHVPRV